MNKGIISILSTMAGAGVGAITVGKVMEATVKETKKMSDKHLALFLLMNQWVKIKQEGKNLSSYLEHHGYNKIAIYGMSYAGETLVEELKGTNIEVAYGIDRNADSIYTNIELVSDEENLMDVDAVVVTAISFFDEVQELLSKKINCPIISLEDIVYGV